MTWAVGDLARYGTGPSALMRIESFHGGRAYGRGFHSSGSCTNRQEETLTVPSRLDVFVWSKCHDENDAWIRGRWGSLTADEQAEFEAMEQVA